MIGSLYSAISGLDAFQKALAVESNNIANVNTVGFKSDSISFADALYQSGIGKGVTVSAIQKDFTQGNIKVTSNPYDLAIQGNGFFVVQDNGSEPYYTRNGTFKMGADGTLQTSDGFSVMGISGLSNIVSDSSNAIVEFDDTYTQLLGTQYVSTDAALSTINAKSTDYNLTATNDDTALSGSGYKTASAKISDVEALAKDYSYRLSLYAQNPEAGTASVAAINEVTVDKTALDDESDVLQITINGLSVSQAFDTDADTTLKSFADKISSVKGMNATVDTTTGIITVNSLIPGANDSLTQAFLDDSALNITTTQSSVNGTGLAALNSSKTALKTAVENAGADFLELTNVIDISTQQDLQFTSLNLKLENLTSSNDGFGEISVKEGVIFSTQDGSKFAIGKIPTVVFNDNLALGLAGNSKFQANFDSGEAVFGGGLATVNSGMLELSNSDLGISLTSLMVYQRAFEASSKAIVTSDEFLNVAIQLKQ